MNLAILIHVMKDGVQFWFSDLNFVHLTRPSSLFVILRELFFELYVRHMLN